MQRLLNRSILCLLLLCVAGSVPGQTFNKRYDLRGIGRAQTAANIEFAVGGRALIIQISNELDTLEDGTFFTHPAIGITSIELETGEKLWDQRFSPPLHGIAPGWANCCDSLPGGGVVVGGSKQDTLQNLGVFLVAFDAEGDTIFTSDLGVAGQQWNGFQVKRTQDGGFMIVGQTDATGYLDGFVIKTNSQGNEEWRRTYGHPQWTDGFISLVELTSGDLVMGGSHYPNDDSHQWWVQRTNILGEVLWDTLWGVGLLGASSHLENLLDGNIIMASNWSYPGAGSPRRFYLAKLDVNDGSIIWDRQYGQIAQFQILFAVKEVPNGDLIACGVSEQIGDFQGVLLRTTSTGDSLWMHKYFYQDDVISQGVGQFYDVLPTPDGGFIATGPVYSQFQAPNPPGYSQDAWVVKVDAYGCIVPGCTGVGITEQATNLLEALHIWPNPAAANGVVNIDLKLPQHLQNEELQLTMVAADGRVVYTEGINPSTTATLNLSQLAAGLYHLHITNGSTWLTGGKLVVE